MKILLIDVNYKFSSTGKIVYDLYNSLNNDGHIASVCYGRGKKVNDFNVFKFGLDFETYMHAILTRITGLTGFFSPLSTFRLLKYIKNFKPDVVHIHELHAYFVNLSPIIKYLKKNNIKTVWTFHCEFMYTGKCGHAYECENWKTECHKCPQLREYPKSLFFDFTRLMYKQKKKLLSDMTNLTIITPSQWLADRVKMSFFSDKNIEVIHNGIDTTNIFYPRDITNLRFHLGINENTKILMAIGSNIMSTSKGGRYFVELSRKFVDKNITFILVGSDEDIIDVGRNLINLGIIKDQNLLAELYTLADLLVLTSEKETFSLVCAESLACGTPVIGFDSGAPKEIAPNGFGEFVDYGDIDKLEKLILHFIEDKSCFNNADNCIKYINDNFSLDSMYKSYLIRYENN